MTDPASDENEGAGSITKRPVLMYAALVALLLWIAFLAYVAAVLTF